ncbi:hypothetical protein Trydic_g3108 [Trypoxylus dichotomus]
MQIPDKSIRLESKKCCQSLKLVNNCKPEFPNVSGCIDCTDIEINPKINLDGHNGEVFRNRKVVAGLSQEILDIVVQHPGSNHDNVIFDRNGLRVRIERMDLHATIISLPQFYSHVFTLEHINSVKEQCIIFLPNLEQEVCSTY